MWSNILGNRYLQILRSSRYNTPLRIRGPLESQHNRPSGPLPSHPQTPPRITHENPYLFHHLLRRWIHRWVCPHGLLGLWFFQGRCELFGQGAWWWTCQGWVDRVFHLSWVGRHRHGKFTVPPHHSRVLTYTHTRRETQVPAHTACRKRLSASTNPSPVS